MASQVVTATGLEVLEINTYICGYHVNRGAGYGLEVPCTYHLYGPPMYVTGRMKNLVDALIAAGHL